jgi:1-deoxy-D-xylulose 5-phosphate reductoisomerase
MSDAQELFIAVPAGALAPVFVASAIFSIAVAIVYHWAVARPAFARKSQSEAHGASLTAAAGVSGLRDRVAALEAASRNALQHVGFVRFNAFPDVGSDLSYALAVVDHSGNGFILCSLYSREEVRTYAKAVQNFTADKSTSAEERRALQLSKEQAQGRRA